MGLLMSIRSARHTRRTLATLNMGLVAGILSLLFGCGKEPVSSARPPTDVTVMTVTASDTPVVFEFVAQTQSSREVEIRARVAGFLEKRLYTEGEKVSW